MPKLNLDQEDPRFDTPRENWKWKILDGPRMKGKLKGGLVEDRRENRKSNDVYPPPGHKWLRVIIFKRGKEYRRYLPIPQKDAKNQVAAKRYAERFRESLRLKEGI